MGEPQDMPNEIVDLVWDKIGPEIDHALQRCSANGGHRPQGLAGVAGLDFVHPDDREKLRTVVVGLFRRGHGTVHFEGRFQRRDGRICWGAWTMTLMHGNAQREKYLLAVGDDTTERHVMQAKLRWQATHDPLTGLLNRRSLLDQLETIVAESGPTDQIGLCFVDLDAFKLVNDQYCATKRIALARVAASYFDGMMPTTFPKKEGAHQTREAIHHPVPVFRCCMP